MRRAPSRTLGRPSADIHLVTTLSADRLADIEREARPHRHCSRTNANPAPVHWLDAASAREASLKRWLFVAFIVLCAAVGRLSYLARPFDSDAAMFIYEGKSAS